MSVTNTNTPLNEDIPPTRSIKPPEELDYLIPRAAEPIRLVRVGHAVGTKCAYAKPGDEKAGPYLIFEFKDQPEKPKRIM